MHGELAVECAALHSNAFFAPLCCGVCPVATSGRQGGRQSAQANHKLRESQMPDAVSCMPSPELGVVSFVSHPDCLMCFRIVLHWLKPVFHLCSMPNTEDTSLTESSVFCVECPAFIYTFLSLS